jgi:hypothetical protein
MDRPPYPDDRVERPGPDAADTFAADVARVQLRRRGIVPIEPDAVIGRMLAPDERVVAVRRSVPLERRRRRRDPDSLLSGDLYVTTRRLMYLGTVPAEYPILDVREAVAAPGVLRLVVGDGRGVEIGVGDPRVLRVEIGAVREAARDASRAGAEAARDAAGDATRDQSSS